MKRILFTFLFILVTTQTVFAEESTTVVLSFPDSKFKVTITSDKDCGFIVNGSSEIRYPDSMIVELSENDLLTLKVNCKEGTKIKDVDYSMHWNANIKVEDTLISITGVSNNFIFKIPIECIEHKYGEWTDIVNPSTLSEGLRYAECLTCSHRLFESTPTYSDDIEVGVQKAVLLDSALEINGAILETEKQCLLKNTSLFTNEEIIDIENGSTAKIELEIESIDTKLLPMEVYDDIDRILKSNSSNEYMLLSINLFKIYEDNRTQINSVGLPIKIRILLPDLFVSKDDNIKRNYYIIRIHDGMLDVIDCDFNSSNNSISFETDRFSEYVISYKDNEVITDEAIDEVNNDNSKDVNSLLIESKDIQNDHIEKGQDNNQLEIRDNNYKNELDGFETIDESIDQRKNKETNCKCCCAWPLLLIIVLFFILKRKTKIENVKQNKE